VSGNVSLYNETKNEDGSSLAILPTPAIGGVGLLEDWEKSATIAPQAVGNVIMVIGESRGHLGQSLWLRHIHGRSDGHPPPVDLQEERAHALFVRRLIEQGLATAVHDVSDGGLLVALAEMAMASGRGMLVNPLDLGMSGAAFAFGEDQGRYLLATADSEQVRALATEANVFAETVAVSDAGKCLRWLRTWRRSEWTEIPMTDLRAAHEGFFPRLMGSELTPEFC
jgi:phosphoribosylformylglycinamidine synthase